MPLGNGMAANSEGVDFMQPLGAAWPCRGPSSCEVRKTRAGTAIFFHESDKTIHSRTLLDPMPSTLNHEEAYGGSVGFLHGDRGSGQSASAPRGSMIRRWAPPCRAAGSPRHRCMRDVVDEVEQVCFGSIRAESLGNAAFGVQIQYRTSLSDLFCSCHYCACAQTCHRLRNGHHRDRQTLNGQTTAIRGLSDKRSRSACVLSIGV